MWPISASFEAAIRSSVHTVAIRAQVLDTNFRVVEGGEFYSTGSERYIQNYIVDGSVDVDVDRATRRTFTMQLLNPDAQFSPGSDWGGLFYVNRLIRIWRGVDHGTTEEWIPIGTFFIDNADVVVERNMSMVVLSGSDQWKKLTKSQLGAAKSYAAGTSVNDVLKDLAGRGGVGASRMVFDDLNDRASAAKTLSVKLSLERTDKIGEAIIKLGKDFGLDIYFDPLGRFTTSDWFDATDRATVWTYAPGETNNLLGLRASYNDDTIYNHVLVIGTGDRDAIVRANLFDRDPSSPTNITRLGRRTLVHETDTISTQAQANSAARKLFAKHMMVSETMVLDAICNPAFEGNDVVAIKESEFINLDRRYRLKSFSVPLASSRQPLKMLRAVDISGVPV